ncbi:MULTISPECIES: rubredoxin [Prochlorococcus]|uniref:Rubredoxin n=1 Tax=Prochlorococcus marinus (strain SARG / CCMP1375 / SS120) TaxID=167539 RepID=Q7VDP2_PROMA|nr:MULTISPECIES: rubredoxin [Prochlorococcus]AAP99372.1 Rubredoxin [Prochlorococcus marinus subsp. marinus str. CCMP1375]KGG11357.1 Rubredoxin [Prochlorococcus marinus str. LG]KGG18688.1 Rubredoxin [Prochlorococcus marinus str. SS2]KGG22961.1 Rubredoxin [Prochlorococcus marinus str. SS35]KGG34065.1 Rubredoxin [Prochlorococcus marinus str. SS51]
MSDELKPALDQTEANKIGQSPINAEKTSDHEVTDLKEDLSLNRFECTDCGYVYDPKEGLKKYKISPGTSFLDIDQTKFRCPVCRSKYSAYKDIGAKFKPSDGFEENVVYGFGFNTLPPGQKNVLIFGGLAFAAACFLSLYSLH